MDAIVIDRIETEARRAREFGTSVCALVLGVTLWAITRAADRDLAMLALACRVIEAVPGHDEIYFAGAYRLPIRFLPFPFSGDIAQQLREGPAARALLHLRAPGARRCARDRRAGESVSVTARREASA